MRVRVVPRSLPSLAAAGGSLAGLLACWGLCSASPSRPLRQAYATLFRLAGSQDRKPRHPFRLGQSESGSPGSPGQPGPTRLPRNPRLWHWLKAVGGSPRHHQTDAAAYGTTLLLQRAARTTHSGAQTAAHDSRKAGGAGAGRGLGWQAGQGCGSRRQEAGDRYRVLSNTTHGMGQVLSVGVFAQCAEDAVQDALVFAACAAACACARCPCTPNPARV